MTGTLDPRASAIDQLIILYRRDDEARENALRTHQVRRDGSCTGCFTEMHADRGDCVVAVTAAAAARQLDRFGLGASPKHRHRRTALRSAGHDAPPDPGSTDVAYPEAAAPRGGDVSRAVG